MVYLLSSEGPFFSSKSWNGSLDQAACILFYQIDYKQIQRIHV